MGEGTCICFWHDRWIGDNTLKSLYLDLFLCSANKDACIFEVLWLLEGGIVRAWDLRFYREFEDWKLAASYSLLEFFLSHIPRGERSHWQLKGDCKFDTGSFYHAI